MARVKLTPELIADEARKIGLLADIEPLVNCSNGKVIRTNVNIRFYMSNGSYYYFTEFVFNAFQNRTYTPHCFYAGNRMDEVPFYLTVGEFHTPMKYDYDKPCKLLFDRLTENGYIEGNNWHCAQWGRWRFHHKPNITTVRKTLRIIKQVLNEC